MSSSKSYHMSSGMIFNITTQWQPCSLSAQLLTIFFNFVKIYWPSRHRLSRLSGVIVNITCQWQLFEVADFLSWCHHPPWRCFQVFWLWFKLNQSKQCQSGGPSLATHISFPLHPHLPDFFTTHLFTSSPHESKKTPHYPSRNVDKNKKLVTYYLYM